MNTAGAFDLETLLPPDARLRDHSNPEDRVEIYYDDRGLIDIDRLVADVSATVDPSYEWPNELNIHHFYWPEVWYPHTKEGDIYDNPALFRNLAIHRGLVPKAFHAWLHLITNPPEIPDQEIMQYRNQAWQVARDLFKKARETVVTEKQTKRRRLYVANSPDTLKEEFDGQDVIGEAVMQATLEKHFRGFMMLLERQESIPERHRLIDLHGPPKKIATDLGRLIVPRSLYLASKVA